MKSSEKKVVHPLEPIYDKNSKILLLGSLPSVKSREESFYYAHPQNRFWRVLSSVLNEKLPITNEEKQDMLLKNHIALWDVIHSCYIKGSSDASIKEVKANDINSLLQKTSITTIFTTGKTAQKYYDKYCYPKTKIKAICLPSTSPANALKKESDLIEAYKIILDV